MIPNHLLLDGSEIPLESLLALEQALDGLEVLTQLVRADLRLLLRDPTDRLVCVLVKHMHLTTIDQCKIYLFTMNILTMWMNQKPALLR